VVERPRLAGKTTATSGFHSVTMYDFSRKLTVTVLTNFTANWDAAFMIWNRVVEAYDKGAR